MAGQCGSEAEPNKAYAQAPQAIPDPGEVKRKLRYVGRKLLPLELLQEPAWADAIRLRTPEAMNRLSASLGHEGQLSAIKVLKRPDGRFIAFDGISRLRAAKALGLRYIEAELYEGDVSEAELFWLALEMARTQQALGPVSKARLIRYMCEELGLSRGEAARRLGISRVHASRLVRLLELPREAQEKLEAGKLSLRDVLAGDAKSDINTVLISGSEPSGPEDAISASEYNMASRASEWRYGRGREPLPPERALYLAKYGRLTPEGLKRVLHAIVGQCPEEAAIAVGAKELARELRELEPDRFLWSLYRHFLAEALHYAVKVNPRELQERLKPFIRYVDEGVAEWDREALNRRLLPQATLDRYAQADQDAQALAEVAPAGEVLDALLPIFWPLATATARLTLPTLSGPKAIASWLGELWDAWVAELGQPSLRGLLAQRLGQASPGALQALLEALKAQAGQARGPSWPYSPMLELYGWWLPWGLEAAHKALKRLGLTAERLEA